MAIRPIGNLINQTVSATLLVDPAEIFVAQIALAYTGFCLSGAFIQSITLENGDVFDFVDTPCEVIWSFAKSVTYVLEAETLLAAQNAGNALYANALATATTYKA